MNRQEQQEFLSRPCESNTQWVAKVLLQLEPKERHTIVHALRRLDKHLYKSWAKDMTLNEIMEAVNIFSEAKPRLKEAVNYNMKDPNVNDPGTKQPDELKAEGEAVAEQATTQESAGDAATTESAEEGGVEG